MQRGLPQKRRIAGVDKVVAIASAKGGVGKSTVSGKFNPPPSRAAPVVVSSSFTPGVSPPRWHTADTG